MSYRTRLDKALRNAPVIPYSSHSRICIISDWHRGNGTSNDNFFKNQNLYFTALKYYYAQGFTYIELGDGDELWEMRRMSQIIEIHNHVFWLLSLFHQQNRLYMLYGNHDFEKKAPQYSARACSVYFCTDTQRDEPLFPDLTFHEGLILENTCSGARLYLTHGHQADFFNCVCWKLARFLVRYFWRPLERLGMLDPTSAARNYTKKDRIERLLSDYAAQNQIPLITGHTHRPRLHEDSPYYMNTGSCVHPRCITCMELLGELLLLVKWTYDTKGDGTLYVRREVLTQRKLP